MPEGGGATGVASSADGAPASGMTRLQFLPKGETSPPGKAEPKPEGDTGGSPAQGQSEVKEVTPTDTLAYSSSSGTEDEAEGRDPRPPKEAKVVDVAQARAETTPAYVSLCPLTLERECAAPNAAEAETQQTDLDAARRVVAPDDAFELQHRVSVLEGSLRQVLNPSGTQC